MAEDDAAEPVELELHRRRPARDEVELVGSEPVAAPRRALVGGGEDVALAVPGDEHGVPAAERVQALRLERAPEDVPSDDDPLDALGLDLRENRLERRQIPVDVVERRDAHADEASRIQRKAASAPRRRGRAPDSRHT